jgi:hypothetical protein
MKKRNPTIKKLNFTISRAEKEKIRLQLFRNETLSYFIDYQSSESAGICNPDSSYTLFATLTGWVGSEPAFTP